MSGITGVGFAVIFSDPAMAAPAAAEMRREANGGVPVTRSVPGSFFNS
jgi:hypothetical protein